MGEGTILTAETSSSSLRAERTRAARLRRIKEALQVAVPQLQELELERDSKGTPHLIGRYEHWRKHDARQDEAQFSDGTLRLLGLLWAVLDGRGPLLLEEPDRGCPVRRGTSRWRSGDQ